MLVLGAEVASQELSRLEVGSVQCQRFLRVFAGPLHYGLQPAHIIRQHNFGLSSLVPEQVVGHLVGRKPMPHVWWRPLSWTAHDPAHSPQFNCRGAPVCFTFNVEGVATIGLDLPSSRVRYPPTAGLAMESKLIRQIISDQADLQERHK